MKPFIELLRESTNKTNIKKAILDFIKEDPFVARCLKDPDHSKGQCDRISTELADYLTSKGIRAKAISMAGFKKELSETGNKEWFDKFKNETIYLWHSITETDIGYVDLTGSQYGKQYGGIRIIDRKTLEDEWIKINDSEEDFHKHLSQKEINQYRKNKLKSEYKEMK